MSLYLLQFTLTHEGSDVMCKVMNTYVEKTCGEYDDAAHSKAIEPIYRGDVTWFQPYEQSAKHGLI